MITFNNDKRLYDYVIIISLIMHYCIPHMIIYDFAGNFTDSNCL